MRGASPAETVMRFALPPHVFLCVEGGYVVLLDLKRDAYFALDLAAARGLAKLIPGWPTGNDGVRGPRFTVSEPVEAHGPVGQVELAHQLVARGLLALEGGKKIECTRLHRAERELTAEVCATPRTSFRDALAVLHASTTAAMLLRCCSLERIVRRTRKRRLANVEASDAALVERLRREVLLFAYLRPLYFSARNACLLESLALLEFLARRGLYPAWVFGVRTRPFAAHCWVQQDEIACNDTIERVCRFTPIMAA